MRFPHVQGPTCSLNVLIVLPLTGSVPASDFLSWFSSYHVVELPFYSFYVILSLSLMSIESV